MVNLNKIPATVVTGFLGSGKTTLLSNILKQANGQRIAVIVNEFGELDIDANLLRNCPLECEDESAATDGVYELANGCICCTVQEEFHPVLQQLIERRDEIDHILIETSGLALPKPLVQAFNWPDIKAHCTVDSVITVVDSPAVVAGRFAANPEAVEAQRRADENLDHDPSLIELFEDQLSSADLVILSKCDLLEDDGVIAGLEATIKQKLPREVKMITSREGQIDNSIVMGIGAAAEEHIEGIHTHHDHHHDHDNDHHHAHDAFNSVSVELGEMQSDALLAGLKALVANHTIYRVKGFVAVPGKPMRQVIQGVGQRFESYFDRKWEAGEARKTQVVIIGQGLKEAEITAALQAI